MASFCDYTPASAKSRSLWGGDFDRLFYQSFGDILGNVSNTLKGYNKAFPAVEMRDTGKEFLVTLEAAGVDPKELDIAIEDGVLTVKGEKKHEHTEEDKGVFYSERSVGTFQRSFQLPDYVDAENVKTKSTNGVVTLTFGKLKEKAPKKIQIEA
ncbi:Hsp20/alpha crystallin family protein [bacterium]|nr:Hsp20/alpha crystallin family protein [bacterium]